MSVDAMPGTRPLSANFDGLAFAALVCGAMVAIMWGPHALQDSDVYWHLASGDWMIRNRSVLTYDAFSFTRAGSPWIAQEWLSELLMSAAYTAAGWSGFLVLFGLSLALTSGVVLSYVARSLRGISLVMTTALAFGCLRMGLFTRPHILALTPLAIWTVGLLRARDAGQPPPLALAFVVAVWANLHASFLLAYVLLGAFALEALLNDGLTKAVRQWAPFATIALLAGLATPYGLRAFESTATNLLIGGMKDIGEWQSPNFSQAFPFELAILTTIFVSVRRGVSIPLVRLLILLGLLHMALQHQRHIALLGVVAPLLLAAPLGEALNQPARAALRPAVTIGVLVAVAMTAALRLATPAFRSDDAVTPAAALAALPSGLTAQPVLNAYDYGGYLIFSGVRPYIDGRTDIYGKEFLAEYLKAAMGDAETLDRIVARHRITWSIHRRGDPVVGMLDKMVGWSRIYEDAAVVVHRRVAPAV